MASDAEIEDKRAAYAAGVSPMVATDAALYLGLTLREIAEEWNIKPIRLLLALDLLYHFERQEPVANGDLCRRDGEGFSEYMQRLLKK